MSSFVNTMTSLSVKQGKLWRAGFIEEAIQAWISSCSREAFLKDHIVEWWLIISVSVEDGDVFDFRGMRLDWFRLQVCTQSHRKRPSHLSKHTFFVYLWAVKYSYCPYQRSDVLRFGSLILQVNLIEMDGSTLFFFSRLFSLFQAYTSVSKASLGLADHKELGKMMNTIIFHTKMVDSLVDMLVETSDLSIFW